MKAMPQLPRDQVGLVFSAGYPEANQAKWSLNPTHTAGTWVFCRRGQGTNGVSNDGTTEHGSGVAGSSAARQAP